MRTTLLAALATAAVATTTAATLTVGTTPALSAEAPTASTGTALQPLEVVGLLASGDRLTTFRTDNPRQSRVTGPVTGLSGDGKLVGIDHRVADGKLYGLGDKGGLYTLTRTGQATRVGALTVALEGRFFGVDVNPAADALRIVSDTGQNLRQSFATLAGPTTVDTRLSTPPTVGDTTGITGAAYTNNDASTDTATTLFDISNVTDQVLAQVPANSGTLAPTGALGVDAVNNIGFDIYTVQAGGKAIGQRAYATLRVGDSRGLYTINLLTGQATLVGALPQEVSDIALVQGR